MFKKKFLVFSIIIVLLFSVILVGCGGGNDYDEFEEFDSDEQTEEIPSGEGEAPTTPQDTPPAAPNNN
ncbi:MAG: hypothetical protein ACOCRL_02240 [Bacillota bacterium]